MPFVWTPGFTLNGIQLCIKGEQGGTWENMHSFIFVRLQIKHDFWDYDIWSGFRLVIAAKYRRCWSCWRLGWYHTLERIRLQTVETLCMWSIVILSFIFPIFSFTLKVSSFCVVCCVLERVPCWSYSTAFRCDFRSVLRSVCQYVLHPFVCVAQAFQRFHTLQISVMYMDCWVQTVFVSNERQSWVLK